jgi:hypothetical protein
MYGLPDADPLLPLMTADAGAGVGAGPDVAVVMDDDAAWSEDVGDGGRELRE